ncbi:MAG TPA: hypothetical protein VK181_05520 [Rhizobium sp.]|nr:hypothetical protein [Rhizobium sp.]
MPEGEQENKGAQPPAQNGAGAPPANTAAQGAQPPAGAPVDIAKLLEPITTQLNAVTGELSTLKKDREDERKAASQRDFTNSITAKANELGAKDADYINYLAQKARGEKGDAFKADEFFTALKTNQPDLFKAAPVKGATTTGGAPVPTQQQLTQLETDLEAARQRRDAAAVLSITTKIQMLKANGT